MFFAVRSRLANAGAQANAVPQQPRRRAGIATGAARVALAMTDLSRFTAIPADVIGCAVAELRSGTKTSHWMWFVFPQIAGLGGSAMAVRYAIADLAEARTFLANSILRERLDRAAQAMLDWAGQRSAESILGGIDSVKLRSSMTLFEAAAGPGTPPYAAILDGFYDGVRDPATLARL